MVDVRRLIWDPGNIAHIARHGVTPDEVIDVCYGEHVSRDAYAGRTMIIGRAGSGRMIAVVLEPQGGGVYYPVTARPASRRERRRLEAADRGDDVT